MDSSLCCRGLAALSRFAAKDRPSRMPSHASPMVGGLTYTAVSHPGADKARTVIAMPSHLRVLPIRRFYATATGRGRLAR